jgi:prepilin-type N-terminal cleavage/methylation domain-containing protein
MSSFYRNETQCFKFFVQLDDHASNNYYRKGLTLNRNLYNEAGWTLIELMVVTALLGILAAIAVPNFFSQRNKARVAATVASSESIRTALASFAATSISNHYPGQASITNYTDLTTFVNPNGGTMPRLPSFHLITYSTADRDGDTYADDYSIRFSVAGVDAPIRGAQVIVTPRGVYRCTSRTTSSCIK